MKALFLWFSTILLTTIHADGLAEYTYSLEQNHILLKFEMDNTELQHYRINMECDIDIMSDLCIAEYIIGNTVLEINGMAVVFQLEGASVHNGHAVYNLKSVKNFQKINEVKLKNNCFYDVNTAFKNRVIIDMDENQKSFLLTKDKSNINF